MKILSKNWLVHKIGREKFRKEVQAHIKGKLLDIGCGEKPYAEMVKPYVTEHIGVDVQGTLHNKSNIDRVGTAYEIPAEDGEFDFCHYIRSFLWFFMVSEYVKRRAYYLG